MTIFLLVAAVTLAVLLLRPGRAYAWGPGAHMVIGNWVLQNLTALPAKVRGVLLEYPGRFLHGSLAPDIFIGKGSKGGDDHCHNWTAAYKLLDQAPDTAAAAYAYGYLSHLAADTVAHNVFVPHFLANAPGFGRLTHVYLEMQADRCLSWDWEDAVRVFREPESRRQDEMLRRTLKVPSRQFWVKNRIFQQSIAVAGSGPWRTWARAVERFFPDGQRREILDKMITVSTRAVLAVLSNPRESAVISLDPIGVAALGEVKAGIRSPYSLTRGLYLPWRAAAPDSSLSLEQLLPEPLLSLGPVCGNLTGEKFS